MSASRYVPAIIVAMAFCFPMHESGFAEDNDEGQVAASIVSRGSLFSAQSIQSSRELNGVFYAYSTDEYGYLNQISIINTTEHHIASVRLRIQVSGREPILLSGVSVPPNQYVSLDVPEVTLILDRIYKKYASVSPLVAHSICLHVEAASDLHNILSLSPPRTISLEVVNIRLKW